MGSWCVYMHTNSVNNKKYIGITSQLPELRWLNGYGYSRNLKFGRAIEKYGWDNFYHKILMSHLEETEAKCMEKYLIGLLNTQDDDYGYNMTSGGEGVHGYRHTESSRLKMSIAKSGDKHPNFGNHLKDSTREKISSRLTGNTNACGCIRSDETKRKISESKYKPIAMMKDGIIINTYNSGIDAEECTGISRKNISMCCKGLRKHAGGYEWKFL